METSQNGNMPEQTFPRNNIRANPSRLPNLLGHPHLHNTSEANTPMVMEVVLRRGKGSGKRRVDANIPSTSQYLGWPTFKRRMPKGITTVTARR
ncbi:unnamed protein product [Nesidiocoris tenuis]|uniref:Uncharacterized protein n=1 Tax=Nesidiocoris tenuis TaxID=355587 RepID=A0A6H5H2U1_9HEMI|nr:unnamed protein product [Nesidiocoris tenuis]